MVLLKDINNIKNLIKSLKKDFPDLDNRLLGALTNSNQLCIWNKQN